MPMPWGYRHAERDFKDFLSGIRDEMSLDSDNMAYTAVDGVFQTFRRRLTPVQAMAFGDVLPELLRALFLYRYDVLATPVPFASRDVMTREARSVRKDHNLTPANAIEATARVLRRHVRQRDFDRVLADISPEAVAFWSAEAAPVVSR